MAKGKDKDKGKGGDALKKSCAAQAAPEAAAPLYTAAQQALLGEIAAAVGERLAGKRLAHTYGVAATARGLALAYGADPFEAEAAGLLHDWDKRLTADELWEKAERYGLGIGRDERLTHLLHGPTAAASLPERFGALAPSVFQAVARHTVGALDMTPLDMVVYCADAIEPGRGAAADGLRALVGAVPLEGLFAACVRSSLSYVLETGRHLYLPSVEVWNAYQAHLPQTRPS